MKVWSVKPAKVKTAYAVCVLASDGAEAIAKARGSEFFYLIEPFGHKFKAEVVMDDIKDVAVAWFEEFS